MICPDLNVPANGMVSYSDTTVPRAVGSTGSYSCDTGYAFSGTLTRTCGASGWSASVDGTPTCTGKNLLTFEYHLIPALYTATCADLTPPTGVTITYSPSTTPD